MSVRVLYFAWLRERLGRPGEELPHAPGMTAADALATLAAANPGAFEPAGHLRAAVNQRVTPMDTPLADNDELAFFPPMTGG